MTRSEIISKLDMKAIGNSSVWIKFNLNGNQTDDLRGYVYDVQPSFVTLHTDRGMISVGYSQITKII
jgi:pyridoxine 5'-phosphate synthase PdxJ